MLCMDSEQLIGICTPFTIPLSPILYCQLETEYVGQCVMFKVYLDRTESYFCPFCRSSSVDCSQIFESERDCPLSCFFSVFINK